MQQRSTVTIAQQSLKKMKAELGFFSSSEDEKTVADLRNLVTHQNATDKDIINAFNQVKTTSSNSTFKALSQEFLSKVTSIENYVDNNKSLMMNAFSIPELSRQIFNFIPNIKLFSVVSQLPLPNLFWLTQLSLVCKQMYLAVRAFRLTKTECENPLDNTPKITVSSQLSSEEMPRFQGFVKEAISKDKNLLIEYTKGQPSVTTTIDTACGYCELVLTESEILEFEAGELKIEFLGCQRAYVSVTCRGYETSSKLYSTNISYYYVDHDHGKFVVLAEKNDLISSAAKKYWRFDAWVMNEKSHRSVKKEIKDAYQNFLQGREKVSITNNLISIRPMILSYDGWDFFRKCPEHYDISDRHHEVKFKLAVVDTDRKYLFPEVTQALSTKETNISACQTFLNLNEKKLYLFYEKRGAYGRQITTFYLNEWNLATGKLKVHKLDLSGLSIHSVSREQHFLAYGVERSMSILNSRYVILKLSRRTNFIEYINHSISVLAIIAYDLKKNGICYEKYFSLKASRPYLNFIENLPDDEVDVHILSSGSVVISGPSCVVTIDFPVPLKKEPVFDVSENDSYCKDVRSFSPSLPAVSFPLIPRSVGVAVIPRSVVCDEESPSTGGDSSSQTTLLGMTGMQTPSFGMTAIEIAFYVGLLFLFIALVTMTIMSGVFAFTFSLGFLLVIPFTAFTAGFLLGYFAGEAFLVGDVSHQSDSNLVAPVLENRSREETQKFGMFFPNVSEEKIGDLPNNKVDTISLDTGCHF